MGNHSKEGQMFHYLWYKMCNFMPKRAIFTEIYFNLILHKLKLFLLWYNVQARTNYYWQKYLHTMYMTFISSPAHRVHRHINQRRESWAFFTTRCHLTQTCSYISWVSMWKVHNTIIGIQVSFHTVINEVS